MNFFFRLYEGLLKAMGVFSSLIIASIALLLTIDVFLRNKGLGNMPWLLEVTEYGLFASTFIAAPWVLHMDGHVKVDIFLKIFPEAFSNIIQKYIIQKHIIQNVYYKMIFKNLLFEEEEEDF